MSVTASGFLSRKRAGYGALALVVAIVATIAFYSIYHATVVVERDRDADRQGHQRNGAGERLGVGQSLDREDRRGEFRLRRLPSRLSRPALARKVKAGQVLASLDATSQSSAVEQATTSLKVAKMNYADALTTYANDERSLARDKSTLNTARAGGTQVQQDQNQETLDSAEQQLLNDQNQLSAAQTQTEQ